MQLLWRNVACCWSDPCCSDNFPKAIAQAFTFLFPHPRTKGPICYTQQNGHIYQTKKAKRNQPVDCQFTCSVYLVGPRCRYRSRYIDFVECTHHVVFRVVTRLAFVFRYLVVAVRVVKRLQTTIGHILVHALQLPLHPLPAIAEEGGQKQTARVLPYI